MGAQLRLSGSAATYLVDRLIDCGHIRRDKNPADRRKAVLRNDESGLATPGLSSAR
ncbi:MarR family transcriptional regulator [Mycobacterium colombiense]|uniref:MarR family transcriptional regulator n=1 Tax=Mycobacterium colombiense TaxID=339268 RepID=UPI000B338AEF|nr:MarR family transcriptional regulator [Mycobacterium colombiense]